MEILTLHNSVVINVKTVQCYPEGKGTKEHSEIFFILKSFKKCTIVILKALMYMCVYSLFAVEFDLCNAMGGSLGS